MAVTAALLPSGAKFTVGSSWGHWGSGRLEVRDTATRRVEFALEERDLLNLAKRQPTCMSEPSVAAEESVAASKVHWLSDDIFEFRLMCMGTYRDWIKIPYNVTRVKSRWAVER